MAGPSDIDRRMYGSLAEDVCLLRSDGRVVSRFKGGFRVDSHPEIFSATQVSAMAESVRARREAVEAAIASRRKPDSPRRPMARHEIERSKPKPVPKTPEDSQAAGGDDGLKRSGEGHAVTPFDPPSDKLEPNAGAAGGAEAPAPITRTAPETPAGGGAASGPGSPSAIHSDEGNSAHEGADDGIGLHGSSGGFSAGRGNRSDNDRDGNSLGNDRRHEAAPNGYAGPDRGSAGALRPSAKVDESREEPVNNRAAAGPTRGAARHGERDRRTVEPARGDLHAAGRITLAGDAALGARADVGRHSALTTPQSDGTPVSSDTPAIEARGEAGTIRVAIEPAGEAAGNGGGHHDAGLKTRQPEVARVAPPMTAAPSSLQKAQTTPAREGVGRGPDIGEVLRRACVLQGAKAAPSKKSRSGKPLPRVCEKCGGPRSYWSASVCLGCYRANPKKTVSQADRIAALEARLDRFERLVRDAVAELVERLDAGWGNGR